jgi:hypothetical protein
MIVACDVCYIDAIEVAAYNHVVGMGSARAHPYLPEVCRANRGAFACHLPSSAPVSPGGEPLRGLTKGVLLGNEPLRT